MMVFFSTIGDPAVITVKAVTIQLSIHPSPNVNGTRDPPRQGPRFSIRMIIWIFSSDTETGAVTPLGRGAETLTALKI